jgi:phosphopantothenoylcysteine decarboxylase / phosphopantothenate---cysteine ligase
MGSTILLCVSGSIAAYKAADLASKLTQAGHAVTTLMTAAAQELVSPNTFLNLTGRKVYVDLWDPDGQTEHIALTDAADLVVVAPATANTLAKIAHGLADDMVSTTLLAVASPVLVCPAMNARMWRHPIVQKNLGAVRELGYHVLEPQSGNLACGHVGPGRLPETPQLIEAIDALLAVKKPAAVESRATDGLTAFLELVVYDAPPAPEALERERAYRAALAGALLSSASLGSVRRAYVHRARNLDEVLERAKRSPLAGSGCRIEVFPWRPELGAPPGA